MIRAVITLAVAVQVAVPLFVIACYLSVGNQ